MSPRYRGGRKSIPCWDNNKGYEGLIHVRFEGDDQLRSKELTALTWDEKVIAHLDPQTNWCKECLHDYEYKR